MEDKDFMENIVAFMKAQQKAEKEGEKNFVCPICGGDAYWVRATRVNNHLHCGCNKCGIRMHE